ncbi:MAG: diguanylate cyclase [Clostridia bacterium]|nr:diguanylate cyclase [Clostridia bacterium]
MEEFYTLLLESIPYPIWVGDLEGRFIFANHFFTSLYHLDKKDFIGRTNENLFDSEMISRYNEHIEEIKLTLETRKFEVIINSDLRECLMYPILGTENELIAVGGMISDTNEKIKMQQQLKDLSHKDMLTGLYNRSYFKEILNQLHSELSVPVSIIMCDINGLRLLNGAFGQAEGDKLIKRVSGILEKSCEGSGYLFRWGGDEFVILLPNCDEELCEKTIRQIVKTYQSYEQGLLQLSLSVGSATTHVLDERIYEIIKDAESHLFRQKLLEEKSVRGSIMFSLQNSLEAKNVETEKHTERMVNYSLAVGKLLDFRIAELDELVLVTKLHDIGKIGISEDILLKPGKLTAEEFEVMKTHTEKGLRIVEASNELAHVGRGILTHHERWDGKGYPLGLKGEEIPLISRIVGVIDSYDAMTNDRVYKKGITKQEAINELRRCSGFQFDPDIVELFIKLVENE